MLRPSPAGGYHRWMDRLRGLFGGGGDRREATPAQPPVPAFDAAAWVDNLVDQGYLGREELIATTAEMLDEGAGSAGAVMQATALVDGSLARHRADEALWPSVTDNDRLDRAFAALDRSGVVARQNFACCRSCGFAEIGDEVADPATAQGFVFFHNQDTERAADGGGLYLAYGSFRDEDRETAAVGRRVVAALAAEGLTAEWDGSPDTRIAVPVDWKRRRAD
jgi:uncharacterized protein DUF6891